MGTWRKMRKADHNSKKNTQKTTVNHRNTTQKHEFPRWERGEKWAKQITTATTRHREPQRITETPPKNTSFSDGNMETNEQSRPQQQHAATKTHREPQRITETPPKNTRFPDGNVEKNEQSRSQQQLKHTENHRNTTQKHEFPRWEHGEKWAKQTTTATCSN